MSKTRRTRSKTQEKPAISPVILIGGSIAAVLLVVGLIILGNQSQQTTAAPVDTSQFPTEGDPNAPVEIVEYSDFGCPHCRDFNLEKLDQIIAEYVDTGQVRYVSHPYYLGNPQIGFATEAALCANDQGRFADYQRALFENQGSLAYDHATLTDLAASLGLNSDQFEQCLADRVHQDDVESGRQAAMRRGVNSTPTFFVNNQRVEGNQPYSVFQQIIEQELAISQ